MTVNLRTCLGELSAFYWLARSLEPHNTIATLFEFAETVTRTAEQSASMVPLTVREARDIKKIVKGILQQGGEGE